MTHGEFNDDDLHRYVDDELDDERKAAVAEWIKVSPEAAIRVQEIRAVKSALHAAYDHVLNESIPERLLREVRRPRYTGRWLIAASLGALVIGASVGWFVRGASDGPALMEAGLKGKRAASWPEQAVLAHVAFVPEVRHPVEVTSKEEDHLIAWLSKRLGKPVKTAKLSAQGYELMGGRLLPGDDGPVAQFMYQNAAGKRLTLMVTRKEATGSDTAFQFLDERGVHVFYWVDGSFGYALSGDLPRADMLVLANAVYKQINP